MLKKLEIKRFVNSLLSSNSFILYQVMNPVVWVVDPGDSEEIGAWIHSNGKVLKGIILTHYHIDHIIGVNDLKKKFQDAKIYASKNSKCGLFSSKLNGSLYLEISYVLGTTDILYLDGGEYISLWDEVAAEVFSTPGHNDDCVSYYVEDCLFTGDALIPGVKPHVRSRKADRATANASIKLIFDSFSDKTDIYPGHREIISLGELRKRYDFEKNEWIHKS